MSEGKPYTPAEKERAALRNYLVTSLDCHLGLHQRCRSEKEVCDCTCHPVVENAEVKK